MSMLLGLGQGLQQAAGTVGDMYRQKESNRRYGLEQDLAERERRDRVNADGVAAMDRQAGLMQDQKQFEIKNAADQSFRNNSYGMDMMRLDHDAMNANREYELGKERNAVNRIMANNQGIARGGGQDRLLDEQRRQQLLNFLGGQRQKIDAKMADLAYLRASPAEKEMDQQRLQELDLQMETLNQSLMRDLLPPSDNANLRTNMEAIQKALGGGAGRAGRVQATPPPNGKPF